MAPQTSVVFAWDLTATPWGWMSQDECVLLNIAVSRTPVPQTHGSYLPLLLVQTLIVCAESMGSSFLLPNVYNLRKLP